MSATKNCEKFFLSKSEQHTQISFSTENHHAESVKFLRLKILMMAQAIEPDWNRMIEWWAREEIDSLGGLTPEQLVTTGHGNDLELFLVKILIDEAMAKIRRD